MLASVLKSVLFNTLHNEIQTNKLKTDVGHGIFDTRHAINVHFQTEHLVFQAMGSTFKYGTCPINF